MCETRLLLSKSRLSKNLKYIRSKLPGGTKILVNLKANAYGHGASLIGAFLQDAVDYFSVACQKEGVALRKAGIKAPVLVYNPPVEWNADFFNARLEPVLYSIDQTKGLIDFIKGRRLPPVRVHIKLDTGMHRSGLMPGFEDEMIALLKDTPYLKPVSVLSHLAAADDPDEDAFTRQQIKLFDELSRKFFEVHPGIIRHIANSSAIFRFPGAVFDMVRPGLSVYGISPVEGASNTQLFPVGQLITRVTQLRTVKKGDTVGYNRTFTAQRDTVVALVPTGYGDGYKRALGYGNGYVVINEKKVPVIGKVNMDMLTLDVTDTDVQVGDTVILFGDRPHVKELARIAGTIPYEITTAVSQRVTRVWQNF
jgi:alanine racemase